VTKGNRRNLKRETEGDFLDELDNHIGWFD